ncbi:MAG TPA: DsbA family oxidoreductase [Cyclobacteriaceae bacterium]
MNTLKSLNKPKITIDVVSDVVCPWCYIGKRRLEKAMNQLSDQYDFEVAYQPFELNPDMPKEGVNQKEYLSKKFGGEARYDQITGQTTQTAAAEGLKFDFSKQKVSPNTRDAHRIIYLSKEEGKQPETNEAFMKAYFEEGVDLSKKENLVDVAVKAGLSEEKVKTWLASDQGLAEVELSEQINHQRGISGVPFFIINNKYGVSGAQPSDAFIDMLTQVGKEVATQGESCDVDAKDC